MADDEKGQEASTDKELELEESDERGDADETGGVDEEKSPIPYDRFQKVARERREAKDTVSKYDDLGSPEDIAESLGRLAAYERMSKPEKATVSKDDEAELEAIGKIRKELIKVFPALENIEDYEQGMKYYYEGLSTEAWYATESLMKREGMDDLSEPEVKGMSDILIEIVSTDKRLRAAYNVGNVEKAVNGAFTKLQGRLGTKSKDGDDKLTADAKKATAKRKLQKLPVTHDRGGSTPVGTGGDDEGPKTWKEAGEAAMKRLEGEGF